MTVTLEKVLKGEIIPGFKAVAYNTSEKKKNLEAVIKEQKEILKRKDVDWNKLNSFVIKL